jgi:acetaldehyde dehydrogenase
MQTATRLGVRVSDRSIDALIQEPDAYDLVFDATSAQDHLVHWPLLRDLKKMVIDMTPSKVGKMCIPALDEEGALDCQNVNMVSCGGQASVPLAHVIAQTHGRVAYIEVVSSIASLSAGPATRANIDQYVETTEEALRVFSGCERSKAILNLNPAEPSIDMQTTIFAQLEHPRPRDLELPVQRMVERIQSYVPGYELIVPPRVDGGRLTMMVKVRGLGDYLPRFAGNLDIMNCAAIRVAEAYSRHFIPIHV